MKNNTSVKYFDNFNKIGTNIFFSDESRINFFGSFRGLVKIFFSVVKIRKTTGCFVGMRSFLPVSMLKSQYTSFS